MSHIQKGVKGNWCWTKGLFIVISLVGLLVGQYQEAYAQSGKVTGKLVGGGMEGIYLSCELH